MAFLTNRQIMRLAKAGLSVLLLYLLFRSISWNSLVGALLQAQKLWFLFAIAAAMAQIFVSAWRWQLVLGSLGFERSRLHELVHSYFVSGFFNNLAPANIAGDVVRVNSLMRDGCDGAIATGSVVLERLLNMAGLALLCLWVFVARPFPLAVQLNAWMLWAGGAVLLAVGAACLWLWRSRPAWLLSRLGHIRELLAATRSNYRQFIGATLVTIALLAIMMLINFGSLQAMAVYLPLSTHLAVYAVAGMALTLPLTIQGIGVRESIYVGLLGLFGVDPAHVLAALALNYVILLLLSLLGGALFWMGRRSWK